jgi:hypothetical protein
MGMVRAYLMALWAGLWRPFDIPELSLLPAVLLGTKHGRWVGRWLHGKPTRAMIYKIFVLVGGILVGFGYVCWDTYYRPITGIFIGTIGLLMFAVWGISEDDLKDSQ